MRTMYREELAETEKELKLELLEDFSSKYEDYLIQFKSWNDQNLCTFFDTIVEQNGIILNPHY